MTEYEVRYLDNHHSPGVQSLMAVDAAEAIRLFHDLHNSLHITSVLPHIDKPSHRWTVYVSHTRHGEVRFNELHDAEVFLKSYKPDHGGVDWYNDDSIKLTLKERLS